MADVCNRTTGRYIESQDKTKYPLAGWIHFDDPTTVLAERARIRAIPQHYRKIVGDVVSEKNTTEKAAADAALRIARRAAIRKSFFLQSKESTKIFKIEIDDTGTITGTEVV